MKGKTL